MIDEAPVTTEELTDYLWDRYGTLTPSDLPDDVLEVAAQCVLDWFACAVAGSQEPLTGILIEELATGTGPATVVGDPNRLVTTGMLQAAMINGAAGHALDFDDTNMVMGGHPTVPVLPAVLALSEVVGASGAEALLAFVVGLEIESIIGNLIGERHYNTGWHKTSTVGVMGAAAAASHLLGLDRVRFGHAMGLAASNAAGLKANFGTMTKPYHAGHAAERGLLAARLAGRGFTANHDAIGGNQGLSQAAADGILELSTLNETADRWFTTETLFKHHAACYLTHAGIEATLALVKSRDLSPGDIDRIELSVYPALDDVCNIRFPSSGLEAKFSLRATQALAVHGVDTSTIAAFDDGPINQPKIQKFLDQVRVDFDESMDSTATKVTIVTTDGTRLEQFHDCGVPAADLEAQREKLEAKFLGLTGPILGREHAVAVLSRLRTVADRDQLSVASVLQLH